MYSCWFLHSKKNTFIACKIAKQQITKLLQIWFNPWPNKRGTTVYKMFCAVLNLCNSKIKGYWVTTVEWVEPLCSTLRDCKCGLTSARATISLESWRHWLCQAVSDERHEPEARCRGPAQPHLPDDESQHYLDNVLDNVCVWLSSGQ
jgi:hypothetical protein